MPYVIAVIGRHRSFRSRAVHWGRWGTHPDHRMARRLL